jgi:hypothetical protein
MRSLEVGEVVDAAVLITENCEYIALDTPANGLNFWNFNYLLKWL